MIEHELRIRTRTLLLFWTLMLVFCMGTWAGIIWLVAWLVAQ